jgi:hypothetical protein
MVRILADRTAEAVYRTAEVIAKQFNLVDLGKATTLDLFMLDKLI